MSFAVPATVEGAGRTWTVRRAWPMLADGGLVCDLELRSRGVAGVRAGRWSPSSGAVVQADPVDRRLPALSTTATTGELVAWRFGKRAVVRLADGSGYAKVVRTSAAEPLRSASAGVFAQGFALAAAVSTTAEAARGVLRFPVLPGRTLYDVGAQSTGAAAAWRAWGRGWAPVLRDVRAEEPGHGPERESTVVDVWTTWAALVVPDAAAALRLAGLRVRSELLDGGRSVVVPAHRDLHDKQLLWSGAGRLGLLDLDTATTAEAALDLGNLRAHVAFRAAQGRLGLADARDAVAEIDRVAAEGGVSAARVATYELATRLRLGCLYLFRPAWRDLALQWLRAECDIAS